MGSSEREIEDLRRTIEKLEQSRFLLGDEVTAAATRPLRERLSSLESAFSLPSQRKLVTILFADLVGYTTLSERMDAEEVSDLMNALWERLDAIVVRHGGQIDKHMGDSLMALWGASETREDDAERAVRASLALAEGAEEFGAGRGLDLKLRIGVNSGPVLIGGVGSSGEQTAMGDTVNVASRLQKEAPPGSVVVSGDVASLARGLFEMESLGAITARGREAQVHVHLVRKALPRQFRPETRGIPGVVTTMVGREDELMRLREAYSLCIGSKRAGIVLVSGEAGIGKSRLLGEFSSRLASGFGAVELLRGRASPETASTPRGLLRDVFRERFGMLESDSPTVVLEKMRSGTSGILDPERAAVLGHYIGFDLSQVPAVRDLLGNPAFIRHGRGALLDLFSGLSSRNPVVVLLEDLHWSDDSSLELVSDIVRSHCSRPIIFLCSARPEFLLSRPEWRDGDPILALVELASLTRDQSAILADQILRRTGHVPAELRRFLVESAEGNPFYLEELVGMLIQDGVIGTSGETWSIDTGKLSTTKAPPTLKGILQTRLDGLEPEERDVLQKASVVGRHFWDLAVAYLLVQDEPASSIGSSLDSVCRSGLVQHEEPSAFEKAREFSFRHALLREVAYDTVLLRKRKAYHSRVAAWLESIAGERLSEYMSQIATHLELAGDLDGAASRFASAGESLRNAGSTTESIAKFEKALSLATPESAGSRIIRIGLADSLCNASEFDKASGILDSVLEESRGAGDLPGEGNALRGLGAIAHARGDLERAKILMTGGLKVLKASGDRESSASCLNNIGCILHTMGDLASARAVHEECLALRRELGLPRGISSSLNNLGALSFAQDDLDAAEGYFRESLALCRQSAGIRGISATLANLASVALSRNAYHEAEALYSESLALRRRAGDRSGVALMLNSIGGIRMALGDEDAALTLFEESLALSRNVGNHRQIAACLANLADAKLARRESAEALDLAIAAVAESLMQGSPAAILNPLRSLASALSAGGRTFEAAELAWFVSGHPAADRGTRKSVGRLMEELRQSMPSEDLDAAEASAGKADLEALARRFLSAESTLEGPTSL